MNKKSGEIGCSSWVYWSDNLLREIVNQIDHRQVIGNNLVIDVNPLFKYVHNSSWMEVGKKFQVDK